MSKLKKHPARERFSPTGQPARQVARRSKKDSAVWVGSKRPVFIFVGVFVLLMGIFYAITFIPPVQKRVLPGLLELNARASAAVLNVFGEGAEAVDTTLRSRRYSVNIAHGCDAIEPIALFIAAVLAFPAPLRTKWPGLLAGVLALTALNVVRIISLFYVGIHWQSAFETMHEDVWQPAFIVFSLFFWVVWALWATKPSAGQGSRPQVPRPPKPESPGPLDAHALT
jgi:exosortase H (IPTLxxWG-CTERM-specific)